MCERANLERSERTLMSTPDLSHRFREVALRLVAPDGSPVTTGPVAVGRTRHAFGFGNIGFDFVELLGGSPAEADAAASRVFGGADAEGAAALLDVWLSLFDTVTLPF